jgi:hypothetical protein
VSHQVKALEKELGVKLFNRERQRHRGGASVPHHFALASMSCARSSASQSSRSCVWHALFGERIPAGSI